jgi:hypothetical protein
VFRMKCQDFGELVITLARNQLMEAAIREESLAHAEICGRCRRRLRAERALLSGINAVVAEITGDGAPVRVETALLAAFRDTTPGIASSIATPRPGWLSHRWSWKVAAVAAGILILISVMAILLRSSSPFNPPREENAGLPPPITQPQAPPVAPELVAAEQPENRPKRVRHARRVNRSEEVEVVTRFFLLREREDLTALESLRVVRMELTSSALGELGLLVDAETANEPVRADVLMGQDGLARAIRFVHLAQVR